MVARGLVLLGSLVLALGAGELALRVLYSSPPGLHFAVRPTTYRLDPELAFSLRPGAELVWHTAEFTEQDRINADGFRDEPVPVSGIRILAVGDSFTFGHGVQMEESYPKVLQELLRADGTDVRVVNAGVPGYGLDQEYRFFVTRGEARVRPDVLLIGVQCSDVFDAYDVPLYDVRDGRLVALDATRTWPYLQGSIAQWAPPLARRSYTLGLALGAIRGRDPYGQRPRLDVPAERWAREKMRLQVVDLFERGRLTGFTVAAVLTPCWERLDPVAPDPYGSLAAELAVASVPTLDSQPAMAALEPELRALFFPEDRHLTSRGNRVLATAVASFLRETRLLDGRRGRGQGVTGGGPPAR